MGTHTVSFVWQSAARAAIRVFFLLEVVRVHAWRAGRQLHSGGRTSHMPGKFLLSEWNGRAKAHLHNNPHYMCMACL